MTSYVTPELNMPLGEKLYSKVVNISGGVVSKIYSFAGEQHTMAYVTQIYLSNVSGLKTLEELHAVGISSEYTLLYAYSVDDNGILSPLL